MKEKKYILVRGAIFVLLLFIMIIGVFSPNMKLRNLEETERYTTTVSSVKYHSKVEKRGSKYRDAYYLVFQTSKGECFCRLSGDADERKTQVSFFRHLEESEKEVVISKIEFRKLGFGDANQVVDVRDDSQVYLSIEAFNNRLKNTKEICLVLCLVLLIVTIFKYKPILDDCLKTNRKKHKKKKT